MKRVSGAFFFLTGAISVACLIVMLSSCTQKHKTFDAGEDDMPDVGIDVQNHLVGSLSPYLLQHEDNPVDWHPWGEEALARSRDEDKPIFLSIGYSACHWCHVMEHETFENQAIADILNQHFISIKVDREERPDIDEVYMTAVQMMTGSGGWPLSVFLTPDLKPFFGGTYFPPETNYGRIGFRELLLRIISMWEIDRENLVGSADQLSDVLKRLGRMDRGGDRDLSNVSRNAIKDLKNRYDAEWSGFGGAPKFPPVPSLTFLLWNAGHTDDPVLISMVEETLYRMATGGVYDQVGGGFHRYSTDRQWLVPHFEKMLYDNAQLASIYFNAYQETGNPFDRRIGEDILDYVLRDMTSTEGAFYASQDADSEQGEGIYYVWSLEEIEDVLGVDAALLSAYYGITETGNFEGKNILHVPVDAKSFVEQRQLNLHEWNERLQKARQDLLEARSRRVAPGIDDKLITAWNGLMISAMTLGASITDDKQYTDAAVQAGMFFRNANQRFGALRRTYRHGQPGIPGYLDDYGALMNAYVDVYELTFDPNWLVHADELLTELLLHFYDRDQALFFSQTTQHQTPIARNATAYDGAEPSGVSLALKALIRLGRYFENRTYLSIAEQVFSTYSANIVRSPHAHLNLVHEWNMFSRRGWEIAIVGNLGDKRTDELLRVVRQAYLPGSIIAFKTPENDVVSELLPWLKYKKEVDDTPAVYVCKNYVCKAPVTEVTSLRKVLSDRDLSSKNRDL